MLVGYIEHYYIQSEDSYVLKNNKFSYFITQRLQSLFVNNGFYDLGDMQLFII